MYRETRPTAFDADGWADVFGDVRRRPFWQVWRLRRTAEWRLITRYIPFGVRVLDAGCGNGSWVEALSAKYASEGCDYSARMIAQLREGFPNRRWTEADIRTLPYEDGRFGGIVSWGVIEHDAAGPVPALKEFHRALAKDGVIVVTVPRDFDLQRRAAELEGSDGQGVFYELCMSPAELGDFAKEAGFEVLETGILRGANPFLAWPVFSRRQRGIRLGILTTVFGWLRFFTTRYSGMIYCVAKANKPNAATATAP